jgi:hypothetical protein
MTSNQTDQTIQHITSSDLGTQQDQNSEIQEDNQNQQVSKARMAKKPGYIGIMHSIEEEKTEPNT